jgi:hypothetical protein
MSKRVLSKIVWGQIDLIQESMETIFGEKIGLPYSSYNDL